MLIEHYNLPQIYLGNITAKYATIRKDRIHLNDIGSFSVCQAIGKLLENAEYLHNVSMLTKERNSANYVESAAYDDLPERLYEPAESFDWILPLGDGNGWALDFNGPLMESCFPSLKNAETETNLSHNTVLLHSDHAGVCPQTILAQIANTATQSKQVIPCEGCPDTNNNGVKDMGGGWTWCMSPWPVICKPNGIHHHSCPSKNTSGIFLQSFDVDNRVTDDWPANHSREITITMLLLKGYDVDFGQAVVIVWVQEAMVKQAVATLIDTKWETQATVLDDIKLNPSFPIPSPNQHKQITLMTAVIPINPYHERSQNGTRCRVVFHSVLGELSEHQKTDEFRYYET